MIIEWEELVTNIALFWHQPRDYVLSLEMQHIWEVITIMYLRRHPKESLPPLKSDGDELMDLDQERAEGLRAQKKMRERLKMQEELKNTN